MRFEEQSKRKQIKGKTKNHVILSYDFWDAASYDVKSISKIFGLPTYVTNKKKKNKPGNGNVKDLNGQVYVYLQQLIAEMYPYISEVLKLPKFDLHKTFNENIWQCEGKSNVQKLQVIIKAQLYNIHQSKKFSGKWHMDGASERVHCVCAWYYDISDQLTGGDLMFKSTENYFTLCGYNSCKKY